MPPTCQEAHFAIKHKVDRSASHVGANLFTGERSLQFGWTCKKPKLLFRLSLSLAIQCLAAIPVKIAISVFTAIKVVSS